MNFNGLDTHWQRDIQFPSWSHGGQGVQLEGLLSYYVTPTFSIGVGGRYWGMWTTNGQFNCVADPAACGAITTNTPPQFYRAQVEQAGAFVQASYKFGVPASVAARD